MPAVITRAAPATAKGVSLRAGATAGAFAIAAALGCVLLANRPTRALDPAGRRAVALFLYGQADPDGIRAAGLHGLGGGSIQVHLTQVGPCRFRVASPQTYEDVDFDHVTEIRFALVPDPASGLIAALGAGRQGATPIIPELALVEVIGSEDAICDPERCIGRRAFALADATRLDSARVAAAEFRSRLCHGS